MSERVIDELAHWAMAAVYIALLLLVIPPLVWAVGWILDYTVVPWAAYWALK